MAWQAFLKNPAVLSLLTSLAGGVYESVNPNRARELQNEVFDEMNDRRLRLNRQARGKFTGSEREMIRESAEPGLNRLAGNVAQRGLGTSGAGAQVLSQAAVQPYSDARIAAEQMAGQADAALMDAIQGFPPDASFFDDLGAAVQGYYEYRGLRGIGTTDTDPDDDPLFGRFMKHLMDLGRRYREYMQTAGGDTALGGEL